MVVKSPRCTPVIGYYCKDERLGCLQHSKKNIVPLSVPHTLSILLPLFSHTSSCPQNTPLFLVPGLAFGIKKKNILLFTFSAFPKKLHFFYSSAYLLPFKKNIFFIY